uniref:Ubiquitin-conjugating enzyme E2-22 kDa n=1 Tax=Arundo donax TaxID=35708 RepID=A0A0A9EYA6_ARUDO
MAHLNQILHLFFYKTDDLHQIEPGFHGQDHHEKLMLSTR